MRQIPNLLSVARLLLSPYIVWLIHQQRFEAAAVWLIGAAVTDACDGWLARRFGWTSQMGAYLDPVADKVLLVCVFVALGAAGVVPAWFVAIVLARDVLILAFAAYVMVARGVRRLPPTIWGKISTILQSLYVCWAVLEIAGMAQSVTTKEVLLWAATAGTVWSWTDYTKRALRLLRDGD